MRLYLFALLLLVPIKSIAGLAINELMPSPNDDEPEWIELFNSSKSAISIDSLIISDLKTFAAIQKFKLNSLSYAIIARDTAALSEKRAIPKNAILIEAKLPSLNNTGDNIIIKSSSATFDSVYYPPSLVKKGVSIERIDADYPADLSNLALSCDASGSTIGASNCNFVPPVNLSIHSFFQNIDEKTLVAKIDNLGKANANNAILTIYCDSNGDSIFTADEAIIEQSIAQINSKDSAIISLASADINKKLAKNGNNQLKAEILISGDFNLADNSLSAIYYKNYNFETIRINEIMCRPADNSSKYIELWNSSDSAIDLAGFLFQDATAFKSGKYSEIRLLKIAGKSYALVAWDSSIYNNFPYLKDSTNIYICGWTSAINSDKDEIYIYDKSRELIDYCSYSEAWHNADLGNTKGISLEKYSVALSSNLAASWSSCSALLGGTPLEANSLDLHSNLKSAIDISPNPFSTKSESGVCAISYSIPYKTAKINAEIFSAAGVSICKILTAKYSGAIGAMLWDGRDKESKLVPVGAYILYFEAIDTETGDSHIEKKLIVVGE